MNAKTATKLNELQNAAIPLALVINSRTLCILTGKVHKSTAKAITAALTRVLPATIANRIMYGAKHREFVALPEVVEMSCPMFYWLTSEDTYKLALPEITAIINQQNTETLNAYETYRLACEQGVAVPPEK